MSRLPILSIPLILSRIVQLNGREEGWQVEVWNQSPDLKPEDAALPDSPQPTTSRRFTLKDIFDSDIFEEKTLQHPHWMKDNRRLSYLAKGPDSSLQTVWMLDTDTNETTSVYTPETAQPHFSAWSPDETTLLFTEKASARFSEIGNLWLYDIGAGKLDQVTHSDLPQRGARFSPDGSRIGFVRSDNLWTLDLASKQERQWTFDGSDTLYNGRLGWVYEEELGLSHGWEWSPDGKRIAFFQQDESHVPEVLLPDYDDLHMTPHRTRYPRAGDPNPTVRIGILSVDSGEVIWVQVEPTESEIESAYTGGEFYIASIQWIPHSSGLLLQRFNRIQNRLDLLLADLSTGDSKTVLTETSEAWIDLPGDVKFVGSEQFLWTSERDGWNHLYLHSLNGQTAKQITSGEWEVDRIESVDEDSGTVYFTAAQPRPTERMLFKASLNDGQVDCLTESTRGWNRGLFTRDHSRFLHTHSTANQPPAAQIRDTAGNEIAELISHSIPNLETYSPSQWEFTTFQTSDGETLNARVLKPANFDPNLKYPVLMHTYGGPKSQVVINQWAGNRSLWYHLLVQQGYVIFMVDNRGTGARGAAFKHNVYRCLGKWEVDDQIEGARYLASLPWVDAKRIGIWGWSYGGYMTSLCMMRGADVFRAGIAVAPVTEWRLYDSIYTERYMLLPQDNLEGYLSGSPVTHAERLTGRFLLIHGLLDDNVHFQNSVRLANSLQDNKRNFETMYYPGRRHGIDDRLFHLYMTMTEFLRRNL